MKSSVIGAGYSSLIGLGLALGGAAGCDGSTPGEAASEQNSDDDEHDRVNAGRVELFSWWVAPGEAEALSAIIDVYNREHPEVEVINAAISGSGVNAREVLADRLEDKEYPDTFQANFGFDLVQWIEYGDEPILTPIDDLAEEEGWLRAFPETILEQVSYDGHLYAVPVNIHRTNSLFYNKRVFDDAGLTPPTTLEELHEVSEALMALDEPVHPIAVGSKGPWTLSLFFAENVMLGATSPAYFISFFEGKASPDDPEVRQAAEEMIYLQRYFNPDHRELEWNQAVEMVAEGDAAMTVMGDWAKGLLVSLGAEIGEDFGEIPFPGTSDAFVFTGDCFPLLKDPPNRTGARELLRTIGSKAGQDAFNPIKGSIPARMDADASKYDQLSRATLAHFNSRHLVSSLSGLWPASFGSQLVDAMVPMLEQENPDIIVELFRDYYDSLGVEATE